MYILIFSTSHRRDGAVGLTYTVRCDRLEGIGDVCMDIGLLVGYIASGFCFMLIVVTSIASLPSSYGKNGFIHTLLSVTIMVGSFAFPYLLGRGGF